MSAGYVRDVLQAAMPQINCKSSSLDKIWSHLALVYCIGSAADCLQFLCQRTAGLTSLQALQSAVLALFYYAYTHVQDEE